MGVWTIVGGRRWNGAGFVFNERLRHTVRGEADHTFVLEDEDIVCAGFVDTHCHLWAPGATESNHIAAQYLVGTGVVAALDCGSYGYYRWEHADRFWRATNALYNASLLNVCPEGHVTPAKGRTLAGEISLNRLVETYRKAGGRLMGFKLHLGKGAGAGDDIDWLELIREAGDRTGAPIGVHLTDTYVQVDRILSYMKEGDVIIHVCHGKRGAPLDGDGLYSDAMLAARRRGVLMDCATGWGNFSWNVFFKARDKNFYPDFLANDMTMKSWQKRIHRDMPFLLSSLNAVGKMPLEEVFKSVTTRAAAFLRISYDHDANLVVLKKRSHPIVVVDALDREERGGFEYVLDMFVKEGTLITYNNLEAVS